VARLPQRVDVRRLTRNLILQALNDDGKLLHKLVLASLPELTRGAARGSRCGCGGTLLLLLHDPACLVQRGVERRILRAQRNVLRERAAVLVEEQLHLCLELVLQLLRAWNCLRLCRRRRRRCCCCCCRHGQRRRELDDLVLRDAVLHTHRAASKEQRGVGLLERLRERADVGADHCHAVASQ